MRSEAGINMSEDKNNIRTSDAIEKTLDYMMTSLIDLDQNKG